MPHENMQILILNIDRSLNETDIADHFRKFGKVNSCSVVKDAATGKSKGFGFAEMPHLDEAIKAIAGLNGMKIGSSALRVKRAANSTVSKHRGKPGAR
jgi:RNA recognition motif-containing protein